MYNPARGRKLIRHEFVVHHIFEKKSMPREGTVTIIGSLRNNSA